MIQGLWDLQADSIIDVKLGNADADSYKYEPILVLLAWWETINKYKHGEHCYDQWKHFSIFFLSVNSMLGREALVVLVQFSPTMAAKMDEPISHVQGLINNQISIAVARSY